jgi:hypothetical protein
MYYSGPMDLEGVLASTLPLSTSADVADASAPCTVRR